ncbi:MULTISPECIES: RagB/SusD family nutrient uptake outer membrane protein [Butyricimonas]|uniref:RagB/SusD family nutrient uptake outer membrane protein n=1 Tax=Butyricimonas TaxID=574697 RepID=UPI0007FB24AF|nr:MULTISPECIES: RagB/SusD family nutrient uptake outer membrane protein [Butyricimonas]
MKRYKFSSIIGILCCTCLACNSFLTEYSHDQAYVQSYTDLDELLLGSGYMKCNKTYNYAYIAKESYFPYIHFMADETEVRTTGEYDNWYGKDNLKMFYGFYTWQREVNLDHEGTVSWTENQDWNNLYKHINIANTVLSQIDKQTVVTTNDEQNVTRIKGEAHFLRGAYYFILANLYGKPYSSATTKTDLAVPLKLTEYIEDKIYTRATVEKTYEQVLEDLLQAESYLKGMPRKTVTRASHAATCLMLSRVYLYMQNYSEALKWAKACIEEQPNLTDLNGFTGDVFLTQKSPELIFTMGGNYIGYNLSQKAGNFSVSDDLMKQYTQNDLRKQFFLGDAKEGIYKYIKAPAEYNSREVSDNFVLRTSEAYLNLAEAAACLGGEYTAEAQNAYNTLRQNRLANYEKEHSLTGKALVEAIRLERRRELCFEGHRWFDLRRYMVNELYPEEKTLTNTYALYSQNPVTYDYEISLCRVYTLKPHDGAWVLPIPDAELEANYGMPDNPRNEREYKQIK